MHTAHEHILLQSTMNISSYTQRGSLASGSYINSQAGGNDNTDIDR